MTAPTQKPTLIIGLVGQAGAGKDTVAEILFGLWRRDGIECSQLSFSDPIKKMAIKFIQEFGYSLVEASEYVFNREMKEVVIPRIGISARHIMQTLGTEWGQRCIGCDVWIRVLEQRLQAYCERKVTHFVISDVRFAPEVDWLRSQGAVIWRIERPGVAPVREHVSESGAAMIRANRVILNDGTIDDLRAMVGAELSRLNYELGMLA